MVTYLIDLEQLRRPPQTMFQKARPTVATVGGARSRLPPKSGGSVGHAADHPLPPPSHSPTRP